MKGLLGRYSYERVIGEIQALRGYWGATGMKGLLGRYRYEGVIGELRYEGVIGELQV